MRSPARNSWLLYTHARTRTQAGHTHTTRICVCTNKYERIQSGLFDEHTHTHAHKSISCESKHTSYISSLSHTHSLTTHSLTALNTHTRTQHIKIIMHIMRYNDWHRIPPQNPDVLKKKRRAKRLSASEELIIPQVIFFNLFVCVCVCVRVYTHTPTHPHFFFAESLPLATGLTKVEFSKL